LYPTEVRGAGQGFCYNSGRAIGALFPALVGFLSNRLGLATAILLFSLLAYGLMLLALIMLPETKGRAVAAITPDDMSEPCMSMTVRRKAKARSATPGFNSKYRPN
jgi:nitrate/nitrite transporter NarK